MSSVVYSVGFDSATLDAAIRDLGIELHALLERLDPARFRAEQADSARRHLLRLRERAAALRLRLRRSEPDDASDLDIVDASGGGDASDRTVALDQALALVEDSDDNGSDWSSLRARLTAAYDRLGIALRQRAIDTPRNRPTNYLRNLYHIGNGVAILLYIHLVVGRVGMIATAAGFVAFAWTAELVRHKAPAVNAALMRLWGKVAHPDEHWTINSATWMVTALLLLATFGSLAACAVGVAVLGIADPAAALVGRRFGRHRLRGSKTLEGTLAFVAAGALAAFTALLLWHPALSPAHAAAVALAGATPAALAELFAGNHVVAGRRVHIDDNFVVPIAAALGASLLL